MKTLSELQKLVIAFRNARDWAQFHNPKDSAISLSLEAAEVLEHFQWKNPEEMQKHLQEKGAAVGEELADVLYWLLLMSHDFGIDLGEALEKKMEKNEKKYPVEKAKGSHQKYTAYEKDVPRSEE